MEYINLFSQKDYRYYSVILTSLRDELGLDKDYFKASETEIWKIARTSKKIPNLSRIHNQLVSKKIKDTLEHLFPNRLSFDIVCEGDINDVIKISSGMETINIGQNIYDSFNFNSFRDFFMNIFNEDVKEEIRKYLVERELVPELKKDSSKDIDFYLSEYFYVDCDYLIFDIEREIMNKSVEHFKKYGETSTEKQTELVKAITNEYMDEVIRCSKQGKRQ